MNYAQIIPTDRPSWLLKHWGSSTTENPNLKFSALPNVQVPKKLRVSRIKRRHVENEGIIRSEVLFVECFSQIILRIEAPYAHEAETDPSQIRDLTPMMSVAP